MVSQKLQLQGFSYNHVQCRDKWQYMKKRYIKKCDNAGPRGTGEERMNFEFYQELHEIFQKKHNVDPPAVASSLKGLNSSVSEDTLNTINVLEESEDEQSPSKKKDEKKHQKERHISPIYARD